MAQSLAIDVSRWAKKMSTCASSSHSQDGCNRLEQVLVQTVVAIWWKSRSLSLPPPHLKACHRLNWSSFRVTFLSLSPFFSSSSLSNIRFTFSFFPSPSGWGSRRVCWAIGSEAPEGGRPTGRWAFFGLCYNTRTNHFVFAQISPPPPQTSWCTRRKSTSQSRTSWTRPLPSSPATRHLPPHRYHSIPGHNLDKQTHLPAQSVTIQISCALFPLYIYIIYYIRLHSLSHTQLCMPNTFTTSAANGQQSKRRTTAPPNCNSTTTATTDTDCIITLF